MFGFNKKKQDMIYHNNFGLAGVTFDNDDGTSRQDIIKDLKNGTIIGLKQYEFEGKLAIGVYTVDGKQIGNIKEKDIPFVLDRLKTVVKTELFNQRGFYSNDLDKVIFTGDVIIYYR